MTIPARQDPLTPLPGFNFHVEIALGLYNRVRDTTGDDGSSVPRTVITGAFSEVTGLEASMEPKAIRAGGENYRVYQRPGPVSFSTVMLKRGIVTSRHLWAWWSLFSGSGGLNGAWGSEGRADVSIFLIRPTIASAPSAQDAPAGGSPAGSESSREAVVGWRLSYAMPVKFRVGDLNASSDEIAIEELHLAHEGLHAQVPS
ncbi:phage tail protein [Qipengyuania mesophila]|uniref:phage tail protein n=1 Tax=Qipengyuania mesophila TaxID=2867246 RepID=UPI003510D47C